MNSASGTGRASTAEWNDMDIFFIARVSMWLVGKSVDFFNPYGHGLAPDAAASRRVPFDPARGDSVWAVAIVLGILLGLAMAGVALFLFALPYQGSLRVGNAMGWGVCSGALLGSISSFLHHAGRTVAPRRGAIFAALHAAVPAVVYGWLVSFLVPGIPALALPLAAAAHAASVALLLRKLIP